MSHGLRCWQDLARRTGKALRRPDRIPLSAAQAAERERDHPAAHIHRALHRGTAYAHARSLDIRDGEYVNPVLRELDRLTRREERL